MIRAKQDYLSGPVWRPIPSKPWAMWEHGYHVVIYLCDDGGDREDSPPIQVEHVIYKGNVAKLRYIADKFDSEWAYNNGYRFYTSSGMRIPDSPEENFGAWFHYLTVGARMYGHKQHGHKLTELDYAKASALRGDRGRIIYKDK